MNKGHCITICLLYLILCINIVNQRIDIIDNYYYILDQLKDLNRRLEIEKKVIVDIREWLPLYKEDDTYWPFDEYSHNKDMRCIEYTHHDFTMIVYYDDERVYDYEISYF